MIKDLPQFHNVLKDFITANYVVLSDFALQMQRVNKILALKYIHENLTALSAKVSTVESCTAGMIASILAETDGASKYLTHGYVTYSPESKIELGVDPFVVKNNIYSTACAIEMAKAGRKRANSDICVATTGLVNGSDAGKVWVAVQAREFTLSESLDLGHGTSGIRKSLTRNFVREMVSIECLVILCKAIDTGNVLHW